MKTFKQHLAEQMSISLAAGWITPNGENTSVPSHSHDQYVKDHLKAFNITPREIKALDEDTLPKQLAIQKGAVRYHLFTPGVGMTPVATVGATKNGFKRHKSVIENIMINNRVTNYDVFLTDEDGEFLGAEKKSIFEEIERELKVWLDDIRPMPREYNIHVKTAQEAIEYLESGKVTSS